MPQEQYNLALSTDGAFLTKSKARLSFYRRERLGKVGREPSGSSDPTSLLRVNPEHTAQNCVRTFWNISSRGDSTDSGRSVQCMISCTVEFFLTFRWSSLCISSSHCLLSCCSAALSRAWCILCHLPADTDRH